MRYFFLLLLLIFICTCARAQIESLPTIDDPKADDRIDTYTRGFPAAFRLDTLRKYYAADIVENLAVDPYVAIPDSLKGRFFSSTLDSLYYVDYFGWFVNLTPGNGPQGPAGDPATDDQTLTRNDTELSISGGNTVNLNSLVLSDDSALQFSSAAGNYNLDDLGTGWVYASTLSTNKPTSTNGYVLTMRYNANLAKQTFWEVTTNNYYQRYLYNTWRAWDQIITENDNIGENFVEVAKPYWQYNPRTSRRIMDVDLSDRLYGAEDWALVTSTPSPTIGSLGNAFDGDQDVVVGWGSEDSVSVKIDVDAKGFISSFVYGSGMFYVTMYSSFDTYDGQMILRVTSEHPSYSGTIQIAGVKVDIGVASWNIYEFDIPGGIGSTFAEDYELKFKAKAGSNTTRIGMIQWVPDRSWNGSQYRPGKTSRSWDDFIWYDDNHVESVVIDPESFQPLTVYKKSRFYDQIRLDVGGNDPDEVLRKDQIDAAIAASTTGDGIYDGSGNVPSGTISRSYDRPGGILGRTNLYFVRPGSSSTYHTGFESFGNNNTGFALDHRVNTSGTSISSSLFLGLGAHRSTFNADKWYYDNGTFYRGFDWSRPNPGLRVGTTGFVDVPGSLPTWQNSEWIHTSTSGQGAWKTRPYRAAAIRNTTLSNQSFATDTDLTLTVPGGNYDVEAVLVFEGNTTTSEFIYRLAASGSINGTDGNGYISQHTSSVRTTDFNDALGETVVTTVANDRYQVSIKGTIKFYSAGGTVVVQRGILSNSGGRTITFLEGSSLTLTPQYGL